MIRTLIIRAFSYAACVLAMAVSIIIATVCLILSVPFFLVAAVICGINAFFDFIDKTLLPDNDR